MPPSASRNRPSRSRTAPVKAPATCPKSSLSKRLSLTAPQATSTKRPCGPPAALPISWMARASRDFPVPVSPVIRIVAGVWASRATTSSTLWMLAWLPTIGTRQLRFADGCVCRAEATAESRASSAAGQGSITAASGRSTVAGMAAGTSATRAGGLSRSRTACSTWRLPDAGSDASSRQTSNRSRTRAATASVAVAAALA